MKLRFPFNVNCNNGRAATASQAWYFCIAPPDTHRRGGVKTDSMTFGVCLECTQEDCVTYLPVSWTPCSEAHVVPGTQVEPTCRCCRMTSRSISSSTFRTWFLRPR